jgi:hypothetical protein
MMAVGIVVALVGVALAAYAAMWLGRNIRTKPATGLLLGAVGLALASASAGAIFTAFVAAGGASPEHVAHAFTSMALAVALGGLAVVVAVGGTLVVWGWTTREASTAPRTTAVLGVEAGSLAVAAMLAALAFLFWFGAMNW